MSARRGRPIDESRAEVAWQVEDLLGPRKLAGGRVEVVTFAEAVARVAEARGLDERTVRRACSDYGVGHGRAGRPVDLLRRLARLLSGPRRRPSE